jgi:hypothetical protein
MNVWGSAATSVVGLPCLRTIIGMMMLDESGTADAGFACASWAKTRSRSHPPWRRLARRLYVYPSEQP